MSHFVSLPLWPDHQVTPHETGFVLEMFFTDSKRDAQFMQALTEDLSNAQGRNLQVDEISEAISEAYFWPATCGLTGEAMSRATDAIERALSWACYQYGNKTQKMIVDALDELTVMEVD